MIPAYAQGLHPEIVQVLSMLSEIRHADPSLGCSGNEAPVIVLRKLRDRKNELQVEKQKLEAELNLLKIASPKTVLENYIQKSKEAFEKVEAPQLECIMPADLGTVVTTNPPKSVSPSSDFKL